MITLTHSGITNVRADAVVNAANSGLWEGGGVCGAIFAAAGSAELTKACQAIGHCNTGNAVITPAFGLDAKYIIHAVGPQWNGGNNNEETLLRSAYTNSLNLAKDNGCKSIVFPLISAGIYGYPKAQACQVAVTAVKQWCDAHSDYEINVIFAVPRKTEYDLCNQAIKAVEDNK